MKKLFLGGLLLLGALLIGCSYTKTHRMGSVHLTLQQVRPLGKKYILRVENRGTEKVVVRLEVEWWESTWWKPWRKFEVKPGITHSMRIKSINRPIIKRIVICKNGKCVKFL